MKSRDPRVPIFNELADEITDPLVLTGGVNLPATELELPLFPDALREAVGAPTGPVKVSTAERLDGLTPAFTILDEVQNWPKQFGTEPPYPIEPELSDPVSDPDG